MFGQTPQASPKGSAQRRRAGKPTRKEAAKRAADEARKQCAFRRDLVRRAAAARHELWLAKANAIEAPQHD